MPIWTTYLGSLNKRGGADKVAQKLGSCFVYYVMRNRGNNTVAPSKELLASVKQGSIDWATYEKLYLQQLSYVGEDWMERRSHEARLGNILLICYEKDASHCHRRLLAEEIAKRFGAEYKGEL